MERLGLNENDNLINYKVGPITISIDEINNNIILKTNDL
jgi:hypothetical protein